MAGTIQPRIVPLLSPLTWLMSAQYLQNLSKLKLSSFVFSITYAQSDLNLSSFILHFCQHPVTVVDTDLLVERMENILLISCLYMKNQKQIGTWQW